MKALVRFPPVDYLTIANITCLFNLIRWPFNTKYNII